jgi:hypothetical protein
LQDASQRLSRCRSENDRRASGKIKELLEMGRLGGVIARGGIADDHSQANKSSAECASGHNNRGDDPASGLISIGQLPPDIDEILRPLWEAIPLSVVLKV